MAIQYPHISRAHYMLEDWVRDWPNAVVMGAGYLCYDARDIRHAPYPDCIVSLNLPIPPEEVVASNSYVISEVGKPPDFVLEVASRSTGRRDYTVKREIYARYQVKEYWRFDHTGGRYHDAPLAGDEWINGRRRRIRIRRLRGGGFWGYSRVLRLELHWVDGNLRFWNRATREYLPDLTEAKTRMFAAEAQTVAERVARQMAEAQTVAERTARQTAEAQAVEALAQTVAERMARQTAEAQTAAEQAARRVAEAQRSAEQAARQTAEAQASAEQAARQTAEAQASAEQAARQTAEAQRDSIADELREAIARIRQLEAGHEGTGQDG